MRLVNHLVHLVPHLVPLLIPPPVPLTAHPDTRYGITEPPPPRPNGPPPYTPLSDTHDGTNTNRTTATTRQDETARKHELTKTAQQDNTDTKNPTTRDADTRRKAERRHENANQKRRKRDKNTGRETGRETGRPPQDEKTKRHRLARDEKRKETTCDAITAMPTAHHPLTHPSTTPPSPNQPPRRADKIGASHDTPPQPDNRHEKSERAIASERHGEPNTAHKCQSRLPRQTDHDTRSSPDPAGGGLYEARKKGRAGERGSGER